MREFHVVIERDEDGWLIASVPGLPGCHTQGRTREEVLERIREAILLYLEVKGPQSTGNTFVGVERVEVET